MLVIPLLQPIIAENFQTLQALELDRLIACCSFLSEERDFSYDSISKSIETFGQKCPGAFRPIEPGDFLSISDETQTRFFRVMKNVTFTEWVLEGSSLVTMVPKPAVKTFKYLKDADIMMMMSGEVIRFYLSSSTGEEEIGSLTLPNPDQIWNNDNRLRDAIGLFLGAKGSPKSCWN